VHSLVCEIQCVKMHGETVKPKRLFISNLRFQAVGIKACDKCCTFSEVMLKNVLIFEVHFENSLHYNRLALWLWL